MVNSSFNLSDLNGSNGFVLNGIDAGDNSGGSVSSAGDINGDGIDDLIIGASGADPNGKDSAGESYVVFGQTGGFSASIDLSDLNGSNGFVLNGIDAGDGSGSSVSSAGDINGDGIDDLIIGETRINRYDRIALANSYVVFGQTGEFSASLDLSDLNGSNGFVLNGIDTAEYSGYSVSGAGDINGDGIDDLIIGAFTAGANGKDFAGQSYVVFGQSGGFSASLDLSDLNGSNGFVLNGIDKYEISVNSVSSAGDINGDGIDDLIIGETTSTRYSRDGLAKSYVVFGQTGGFSASLDLSDLNGSNGFVFNSIYDFGRSARSVSSAGDINGDGIDDLIIGISSAAPNGKYSAGLSYVVFGQTGGFSASFDLSTLNGSNGFVLNGSDYDVRSGGSVSGAGDINGDGIDDLIIGASGADPNGKDSAGQSYVVFGQTGGFSASLDLSDLNGSNGFVFNGIDEFDSSGRSVSSAGDINGDGIDDLIIGATGESYVVFGNAPQC